jgi:hypothetical protein
MERREIEHKTVSRLESKANDLQESMRRLDVESEPSGSDAAAESERADRPERWALREVLAQQLRRARAEAELARANAHVFDDLSGSVGPCTCFVVLPNARNDTDWAPLGQLEQGVAVLAVTDPAGGSDWLAANLSNTDRTLSATVGHNTVATTTWRAAFQQPATVSPVAFSPDTDTAAVSDLAQRVKASPRGDGSIITLGLTGTVTSEDRRAILNALTMCLLARKRADINVDAVNKRGPIEQRISTLTVEIRDVERTFLSRAERSGATRESIGALYERSREGQDIERMLDSLSALEKARDQIDLRSHALFDDLVLIRDVPSFK